MFIITSNNATFIQESKQSKQIVKYNAIFVCLEQNECSINVIT